MEISPKNPCRQGTQSSLTIFNDQIYCYACFLRPLIYSSITIGTIEMHTDMSLMPIVKIMAQKVDVAPFLCDYTYFLQLGPHRYMNRAYILFPI